MVVDGDVFIAEGFVLDNGYVHDTPFLIISGGTFTTPLLCVKGTSKLERYRLTTEGCNCGDQQFYKSFYIPKDWNECFDRDTCLDLKQLYPISLRTFIVAREERNLNYLGKMTPHCFHSVLQCFENVADDTAEDSMERIREARKKLDLDF